MAVALVEVPEPVVPDDPTCAWLEDVLAGLADRVDACADLEVAKVSDADRVDRIARLERLKAAAAGLLVAESVRFAQSQVEQQWSEDIDPAKVGRGIADQLALACHVSPAEGSRRLGVARALWFDLPETYRLLVQGRISEYTAGLVVTATRHLDATARRQVDAKLATVGLDELSPHAAGKRAQAEAYAADPEGYTQRGRTERKHRRVTMRPAPDTMSLLSGYLPVEQGVACLAALRQHATTPKAMGDDRSRDQIMADTLVERLTGQASAGDVQVEVQLTMSLDSLLNPDDPTPADLPGHGPLPGPIARDLLQYSAGRKWWRRLFTAPPLDGRRGPVVGGDPQRRLFDGWLAKLIALRDQTCRDLYCDAPIRHLDHIVQHRRGGLTALGNGRRVCERGNYVRELPGRHVHTLDDGLRGLPHRIRVTTPTGHTYTSCAPQPP